MNRSNYGSNSSSQVNFLEGIPESQHAGLMGYGIRISLKSGQILFRQGDPARLCYLILRGRLKLAKLHEMGKEAIVRYIAPGELTAAVSVFREKTYPVTAEATGSVEVVGWDRQTMTKLLLDNPQMALNMLRIVIEHVDELQERYLELTAERVERRVARAILRIMKKSGRKTETGMELDLSLSRKDLADYTGTTLYTVSRILSTWKTNGWIHSGRERITILDPHSLVLLADEV
jgi:CRP/FNR family transcriptional regulator, nitrogen oxide reductase regulator